MMLSSKGHTRALTATFGGIVTMFSAAIAAAQTEPVSPAPEGPEEPATMEPATASGSVSVTTTTTTTEVVTEPAAFPPEPAAEATDPAPAVPAEGTAEEPPKGTPSLFVFGDAWAGIQSAKSGSPSGTGGDVYATNGPDGSPQSGFGLSWLGADIGYDAGAWAVNGSLRFGDAVAIYGTGTLGPITNAYLTWRPTDGLSLSAGTFGTIYGAEVAESWLNLNYTRGEVYFNLQPFWHTGIKAEYTKDEFVARALIANESNTSNLGAGAVNVGGQLGYAGEVFSAYGGVLQSLAPETSMNFGSVFATFVDIVAVVTAGDFTLVGNFDYNAGYKSVISYWGGSLAAGYAFTPQFGMALRGEMIKWENPDEGDDPTLTTGTLTFDVKPVKDTSNFVIRLDTRVEHANSEIYYKSKGDPDDLSKNWYSAVLGVVGYADLL